MLVKQQHSWFRVQKWRNQIQEWWAKEKEQWTGVEHQNAATYEQDQSWWKHN